MASALTYLNKQLGAGAPVSKRFSVQLSGNYTNSGGAANIGTPGETLSFNTATVNGKPARPRIPTTLNGSTKPLPANTDFEIFLPQGYSGQVEQNATNPTANNYVLRIFAAGSGAAAPVELASGAYPAALTDAPFLVTVRIPLKYD